MTDRQTVDGRTVDGQTGDGQAQLSQVILDTRQGAGLGLSIVAAVARAYGGQVRAQPREGGGLSVTVTLPPADAASANRAADGAG